MPVVICETCGTAVWRKPSFVARVKRFHCSVKCRAKDKEPLEERFKKFFTKAGPDDCWEWRAKSRDADGYGLIWAGNYEQGLVRGHRVAYELATGVRPDQEQVLHSCNNPSCVNPRHLRLGTHDENMRDKVVSGNSMPGEKNPNAILTDAEALEIKQRYKVGDVTYESLGKEYGVSSGLIGHIVRGVARKHLT